jgi:hypothetical protein
VRVDGKRERWNQRYAAGDPHSTPLPNQYYQVDANNVLHGVGNGAHAAGQFDGRPGSKGSRGAPKGDLVETLADLAGHLPVDTETLRGPERNRVVAGARALVSLVLVRRFGYRVADVAAVLRRDPAAIGVAISRLEGRLRMDARLADEVTRLSEARASPAPARGRQP